MVVGWCVGVGVGGGLGVKEWLSFGKSGDIAVWWVGVWMWVLEEV